MFTVVVILSIPAICLGDKHFLKPIDTLVKRYGYPFETHTIHTSDGYILTYHRVPHGRKEDKSTNRQPVLLVHGVLACSRLFLANRDNLPYMLADAGFDVWLANYRGNFYSRRHETLDPVKDNHLFWNYTLTELGSSDLPAAIDYILTETGQPRLSYIGESMGTTMFWILGAMRPEYMSKILLMVAITPMARPSHAAVFNNSLKRRIIYNDLRILKAMGYHEAMLYTKSMWTKAHSICNKQTFKLIRCRIVSSIMNFYIKGIEPEGFYKGLIGTPTSSISLNVVLHFVQIAKANKFQMFDYGKYDNMERYKSKVPPAFDLKRVTCPVYLIYSKMDDVANVKDVQWLMKQLPNKPTRLLDNVDSFSHAEFVLNKDVPKLLNKPLTTFMKDRLINNQ